MIFSVLLLGTVATDRVILEPNAKKLGVAPSWEYTRRANADDNVNIVVVLRHTTEQLNTLEETFWKVSNPQLESSYGSYLTQKQVTEMMAAKDSDIYAVEEWLHSYGATSVSIGVHRDLIEATLAADDAEKMLETEFGHYRHTSVKNRVIIRATKSYSVPRFLASAIQIVSNVLLFPSLPDSRLVIEDSTSSSSPSSSWPSDCGIGCAGKVTPEVLSQRYNLDAAPTVATAYNSTLAVAEFQGQVWDQKDLTKFQTTCNLKQNVTVDHEAGRISPGRACSIPIIGTEACGESLLDIEMAKAIGGDIPLTDIYSNSYSLLNWAKQLEDMVDQDLPLVHSVSYGNDERQQSSVEYMTACNTEFQKLAVRGVSILFASGDQGVCGRSGCGFGSKQVYNPDFPAASPYITAVGGTDFNQRSTIGEEKAWTDGGGGFSNTFPAPSYQVNAIEQYKKTAAASLPPQAKWNATGRGYPDVAALAGEVNPYCISAGELMMGIAGTSAASPVVASIFARLNAVQHKNGKSSLGFLNQWIYQNPSVFNDVTKGINSGGSRDNGFPAVAGWDPATGMGTPNYTKMVAALP